MSAPLSENGVTCMLNSDEGEFVVQVIDKTNFKTDEKNCWVEISDGNLSHSR